MKGFRQEYTLSKDTLSIKIRLVVQKLQKRMFVVPYRDLYGTYKPQFRTQSYLLTNLPVYQIWCQSDKNCDFYSVYTHIHPNTHTYIQKIFPAARSVEKYEYHEFRSYNRKQVQQDMIYFSLTSQQKQKSKLQANQFSPVLTEDFIDKKASQKIVIFKKMCYKN